MNVKVEIENILVEAIACINGINTKQINSSFSWFNTFVPASFVVLL